MSEQRRQNLTKLRDNGAFDAVVIGGGVNGIGVYRELALQGLRVLLVERNDFCSGCSAAPSRMIHGGLRYLENGEFDLVRESLRERDALLLNAPHVVRPMPTVIPITSLFSGILNSAAGFFGWQGKPSNRGAVPIKLGLSLYDWVTRHRRVLPKHHFNSAPRTRREWPKLTTDAKRSAVYYDAWITHPERLCIELICDTQLAAPESVALNYAELGPSNEGFVLTDKHGGEQFSIHPKVIVNATGAWLDSTIQELGCDERAKLVSGTKGSHLIIDNPALLSALGGHMVYFENTDGRVCIVFPYQGKALAGSTDIRVDSASRVRCEDEELDYILGSLGLVFPEIALTKEEVVFSYSGIRPLPQSDHDFTGRISRGHFVKRLAGKVPQFCMIGGKWTTFRAFAEQATDEVLKELGRDRLCSTISLPIGGGAEFPEDHDILIQELVKTAGVSRDRAAHLVDHYGTRANEVLRHSAMKQDEPLADGCLYSSGETRWLLRNEWVETLSDIVLRRTALAITGQISNDVLDRLCAILAEERELSDAEISHQRDQLTNELAEYHGVTPKALATRNKERRTKCA